MQSEIEELDNKIAWLEEECPDKFNTWKITLIEVIREVYKDFA